MLDLAPERSRHRQASWLALALIAGCANGDGTPDPGDPGGPGGPGGGNVPPGGPGAPPGATGFCAGSGPVVTVPGTGGGGSSGGACGETVFDGAVCSCTDLQVDGYVATSSTDPSAPVAGSVGVNRNMQVRGFTSVSGSLAAAGDSPLGFYGYLRAGGRLAVAGPVAVADSGFAAGYIEVGDDAQVASHLDLYGYANIGGDLTQPAGARRPTVLTVGGSRVAAPVSVAPPCACGDDAIPDLAGLVAAAATSNDNATIGLRADGFRDVIGVAAAELPCGRYYVDELSGKGLLHLRIDGRVVLHVGGDVDVTGVLDLEMSPGAELDLVIGGDLVSTGASALGRASDPGATRIYVAGRAEIRLRGATAFIGNLYAPRAAIRGTGATLVLGSLFGQRIDVPGFLQVGYAAAVRGDTCEPPTID
jgi:hypothetical protein